MDEIIDIDILVSRLASEECTHKKSGEEHTSKKDKYEQEINENSDEPCTITVYDNDVENEAQKKTQLSKLKKPELEMILESWYFKNHTTYSKTALKRKKKEELVKEIISLNITFDPLS